MHVCTCGDCTIVQYEDLCHYEAQLAQAENSILFHGRRADEAERRHGELEKAARQYMYALSLCRVDATDISTTLFKEREDALARLLGEAKEPKEDDLLDLLRKLASGAGGRRTGELKRRGWLVWEVTEEGRAILGEAKEQ